jgi:hypothetical protein
MTDSKPSAFHVDGLDGYATDPVPVRRLKC